MNVKNFTLIFENELKGRNKVFIIENKMILEEIKAKRIVLKDDY